MGRVKGNSHDEKPSFLLTYCVTELLRGLFRSNCLGMNSADCRTNELEFRICRNCKNIQYNVYRPFEKNDRVYYQRLLTFVIFS